MELLTKFASELLITPLFEKDILERAKKEGFTEEAVFERKKLISSDLKIKLQIIEDYTNKFELILLEKKRKEKSLEKELLNFNLNKKDVIEINKLKKRFINNELLSSDFLEKSSKILFKK